MTKTTGRYADDPRVDRLASWGLNIAAIVALAIGGWFFRGVSASMDTLGESVQGLKTEVAVMRAERKGEMALQAQRISDLDTRVTALEK